MSPDEASVPDATAHECAEERRVDAEGREHFTKAVSTHLSRLGQRGGQVRSAPKKQAAKDNLAKARATKALYRQQPGLRPERS